jgi:hypothetical protein
MNATLEPTSHAEMVEGFQTLVDLFRHVGGAAQSGAVINAMTGLSPVLLLNLGWIRATEGHRFGAVFVPAGRLAEELGGIAE